ncbi:MAG: HD family phosphohydrolase [Pyrinomonadaceae bacterium]
MSKRIEDLKTPGTRWRGRIKTFVSGLFSVLSTRQQFWLGFAFLSIVTTILLFNPALRSGAEQPYNEGEIAREAIIAPADIYFVDDAETERIRASAKESVDPIFNYEPKRPEEAVQTFRTAWEDAQRKSSIAGSSNRGNSATRGEANAAKSSTEVAKLFAMRKFSPSELDAVTRILRENAGGDIYGDQDEQFLQGRISIVDRQKPTDSRVSTNPSINMTKLSEARRSLASGIKSIPSFSSAESEAFTEILSPLIQPSIIYDAAATESGRRVVAESVEPITISLKRGQKIVDQGEPITSTALSQIAAVQNYSGSSRLLNRFIGLLIFVTLLYWTAWKFVEHRGIVPRLALSAEKTFALFGFIVVTQTILMAIFFRLAQFTASQNVSSPLNDPSLWSFAVPFAFGSLLMTLLADRRTALFTGLFTSVLAGFIAPRGLEFAVFAIITSAVAVYGIGRYRTRQTVTFAGLLVGLTSAGLSIAMIAYTQQPIILNTVLLAAACGLASGLVTAAATAMFMPLFESLFGVLTDVKLLELSNADLPVLGQLAMRAPGTNQHSHAVGQLAEEACRVVGGNALLSRIGALYHDIGKTAAPEHFVENQLSKNPHDKLKPAQSAKIIISHVTYGTKLAKEMGLPQRIVDFIPQHHGTRTLHYFLKKAQAEARESDDISENDFRYPGPKPQFRESAIMMIADSCEAAARSLSEPNQENIRFIVTKIIDAIVADDQLDECDLTLRELTQIRESMIRSLVAIYHSRIDYPGYVPPKSGEFRVTPDGLEDTERGPKYDNPVDIPISVGGEVEDEAVRHPKESDTSRLAKGKTS